jgi:hypothetical protein
MTAFFVKVRREEILSVVVKFVCSFTASNVFRRIRLVRRNCRRDVRISSPAFEYVRRARGFVESTSHTVNRRALRCDGAMMGVARAHVPTYRFIARQRSWNVSFVASIRQNSLSVQVQCNTMVEIDVKRCNKDSGTGIGPLNRCI